MKTIRQQLIETEVAKLLKENKLSEAPVDVERIARNLGVFVTRTPSEDDISGFLLVHADRRALIGVNTLHHPNRQRFTIAHEIGHFLLHDFNEVHVDRAVVKLRNRASSRGDNSEEVEANRFAAELLMPKTFLSSDLDESAFLDLHDDRNMLRLARRYQVSVQAMTNRLISLGFLTEFES